MQIHFYLMNGYVAGLVQGNRLFKFFYLASNTSIMDKRKFLMSNLLLGRIHKHMVKAILV